MFSCFSIRSALLSCALALALSAVGVQDVLGQTWSENRIAPLTHGAQDVHAADIDGDGETDLLSASANDDKIAWYEKDGTTEPSFSPPHTITTSALLTQSVYAADVDGDGDTDVLSAEAGGNDKIAWYENDGSSNPSFTAHSITSLALDPTDVFATDVDGDGDTDVLSASFGDDKIAWYENDGNENFTTHTITTSATEAQSVHAADVDGDGDTDVLSASPEDDTIAWYENDGNENFTTHTISNSADGVEDVFTTDVDGDGDTDVLSASSGFDEEVAWHENDGNENFTAHTITTNANNPVSVHAADVDGDGDTDVLSANRVSVGKIAWYENDGNENFAAHTITTNVDEPESVHAADVDGDGDTDVLSASDDDDKIAWYENDGSSNPSFSAHSITLGVKFTESIFAKDIDGNGHTDILSASQDGIQWYKNHGSTNAAFTAHVINTVDAKDVFATDVDGDGDTDVLSATHEVVWYENDGSSHPSFTAHTIISSSGVPSVYAVDVDGDSDTDVLSAPQGDLEWYENNGNENFTTHTISTSSDGLEDVLAADLDADGDMDVLAAFGYPAEKIEWYENDGNENFTSHQITTSAARAISIYARDLDGDGDLDVLTALSDDDEIAWYENDGSENFTKHTIGPTFFTLGDVFPKDVDGDGDTDVLSAAELSVNWYENDGSSNPSFTENVISGDNANSVFATDIDGDGDPDALASSILTRTASRDDDKIAWYDNTLTPSTTPFITTWETTTSSESITIPTEGGTAVTDYNFEINWGDGTTETITGDDPDPSHTYSSAGTYQVEISGTFPRIYLNAGPSGGGDQANAEKLQSIDQWGTVQWESMEGAFAGASNMTYAATDAPELANVTDLSRMFAGASSFNGSIGSWDVSGVTRTAEMFRDATSFNQDISNWDVSGVTDMTRMFDGATSFDQNLGPWDVSGVTAGASEDMTGMFDGSGLSVINYDAILIGWAEQVPSVNDGIVLGASGVKYCNGGPYRSHLIEEFSWTINDAGPQSGCNNTISASDAQRVESEGTVDFTDGSLSVAVSGLTDPGRATVTRYSDAPQNVEGISESNVSGYRIVIAGSALAFDSAELQLAVSSLEGISDAANVTIYKRPTTGAGSFTALSTSVDDNGTPDDISDDTLEVTTGSFSEFVLASNTEPLPVALADFEAQVEDETVQLAWQTASETANARFEVQRRVGEGANGGEGEWEQIGQVDGSGTTTEAQSYRFTDADLPYAADRLDYRLRQVDTDGSAQLSETVTVERGVTEVELLGTYPNPAQSRATVRYALPEKQEATLRLYDMLGRQVRTVAEAEQEGRQEQQLDTSGLPSGVYFLRLRAGGQTRTQKLTVVR